MAEAVYLLCAATSLVCAGLLLRGYMHSRMRLSLWTSACFAALALNNVLLVVDLMVVPSVDLSILRTAVATAGVAMLLYGMIREST